MTYLSVMPSSRKKGAGTALTLLLDRKPRGDEGFEQALVCRPGRLPADPAAQSAELGAVWTKVSKGASEWQAPGAAAEAARVSWADPAGFELGRRRLVLPWFH